jgi:hypothetical protein
VACDARFRADPGAASRRSGGTAGGDAPEATRLEHPRDPGACWQGGAGPCWNRSGTACSARDRGSAMARPSRFRPPRGNGGSPQTRPAASSGFRPARTGPAARRDRRSETCAALRPRRRRAGQSTSTLPARCLTAIVPLMHDREAEPGARPEPEVLARHFEREAFDSTAERQPQRRETGASRPIECLMHGRRSGISGHGRAPLALARAATWHGASQDLYVWRA